MNRKILAMLLVVCMVTSVLSVFTASAENSTGYYQLVASDTIYAEAYGVSNNTTYANITTFYGTGWADAWSSFSKLDNYGLFTGRPSSSKNIRVQRTLKNEIDFSVEGTYTFTASLHDSSVETQDFRFEIGDTGIVFGAVVPTTNSYWYPQLQPPGGTMAVYAGETSTSLKKSSSKTMDVVLEVTTSNSGTDTLMVKACGSGKADPGWLVTTTAEISDKKVSFVNIGFNYCADYETANGVSRIRGVTVESLTNEAPVVEAEDFSAVYTDWTGESGTEYYKFINPEKSSNNMRFNAAGTWSESLGVPKANTTPSLINLIDAPAAVSGETGLSDKLVKITQTANISMARMKNALAAPFAENENVVVRFKIYLTDIYESAASYDVDGTTVIPAVKDDDNSVETLSMRIIPNDGSDDASYANTVEIPVNTWHTVETTFVSKADMTGVRLDFGSKATAAATSGYTTAFAGTIYFDGHFVIEKEKEKPVERSVGSSWKELSLIDFEDDTKGYNVTSSNGAVMVLNTLVEQYPEAEVGTRGSNVYKFSMNNSGASAFTMESFYDNTTLETDDVVSVSAWVFASDATGEAPKLSMDVLDETSADISTDHSTGALELATDEWIKIGVTFKYTGNEKQLVIKAPESVYFNTILIDDVKTSVYKETGMVPASYDYTDDIDSFNSYSSPYIKSSKFRAFGSGEYEVSMHKTGAIDGKSYSGTSSMALSNRNYANMGMKINNIFQGIPNTDDVGKTYRISLYVYADKDSGVYQDNKNRTEFTEEMLTQTTGTIIRLSLAGPDGSNYKYREGGEKAKTFTVPWNVWTKIQFEYTVTEGYLDNGLTDSKTNTLINAVRIDQMDAEGEVNSGVVNTFYVDDFSVKEVGELPVTLAKCFGSNMVLQRNKPINIWGESLETGRTVTVKLGNVTKTTTTTDSGKWSVTFDALSAQTGLSMTFAFDGTKAEETVFSNIAIGDVILAAGQSNMALAYGKISNDVSDINADIETLKNIRALKMTGTGSAEVLSDNSSYNWVMADTSSRNNISAIGMITAYNIAKEQNVPVGIINASLGGAMIETFLSREVLESRDIYADYIKDFEAIRDGTKELERWQYVPTAIYNSMLAPLKGLSVSACVWYQGCNNRQTDKGDFYEIKQQDLVDMFRDYFNNSNMPVAVCQLAPYSDNVYDNQIVHIRQNQLNAAKRQAGVYLIPTCDVGPVNSDSNGTGLIHPSNKRPVAERCYLAIKHHNYGYEGEYSAPMYEYMEIEDDKAILHFSHADGLKIKANNNETTVTGFTISADGTDFVEATAVIDGSTIIVSAESVTNPKEVRYCYTSWTYYDESGNLLSGKGFSTSMYTLTGNLGGNVFNGIDLPLAPFNATVSNITVESATAEKKDNAIECNITLTNRGVSSEDNLLIVALYSDSKIVDFKIIDSRFENAQSIEYESVLDYETLGEESVVKIMVWDSLKSLRPVCKQEELAIE